MANGNLDPRATTIEGEIQLAKPRQPYIIPFLMVNMVSLNDFLPLEFVDCLENRAMVALTVIDSRYKPIHIEVVHIALSSVIDQILGADA